MANPRLHLLSKVLLGTALVMALFGLYLLFALQNVVAGVVMLLVAVTDVVMAVLFARKASS